MAQTQKFFGRGKPAAATPLTLYTAPALTKALLVTLVACNTSSTQDDSINVWVVPSAGAAGDTNVVIKNMVVDYGDPFFMNAPIVLETGDFLVVQSTNGNVAFTASGLEIV